MVPFTLTDKLLYEGDILISLANSLGLVGRVTYVDRGYDNLSFGAFMGLLRADRTKILPKFLFYSLQSKGAKDYFLTTAKTTTNISNLTFDDLGNFVFPVPSLDIQQQVVDELDGYQGIVDGARTIIESYRPVPQLPKNSPQIKICELCETVLGGGTPNTKNSEFWSGDIPWITSADIDEENEITIRKHITTLGVKNSATNIIQRGNVVVASRVGLGKIAKNNFDVAISQDLQGLMLNDKKVIPEYFVIAYSLLADEISGKARGTTIKGITKAELLNLCVPIPTIEVQKQIISQVEFEKALVKPSKTLIDVFTKRIHDKINEIWGE